MIRRYLLIGVVSAAGLLIVTAIITANTHRGDQQGIAALSETKTSIKTALAEKDSAAAPAAMPKADKAVFDVQGMSCSGCIYTIKSGLADMDGISDVLVDVGRGRVEVFYDSTRVTEPQKIASAITAVGYPATLKQTLTKEEVAKENNRYASRSKLYIAAVGDWEISRKDFNSELSHARSRYEKAYGAVVFTGDQGKALMERLQAQITSGLINEGIQMQEIRRAGFKLPAKTVEREFEEHLSRKGMSRQEFEKVLEDSGYDYDYFYKKFENRLTIDRYLNDRVLSGLTSDLEKQRHYSDWFNNARLLAKVVYYDKNLENIVKNSSAGGGCGNSCSTKKSLG